MPWRGGMEPSLDPTTADPIALKLLAQTPPPAAYVSRPCYQDMSGPRCTPERWTMERYSDEIVSSMTEAVRTAAVRANAQQRRASWLQRWRRARCIDCREARQCCGGHHGGRESRYRRVDAASRLSAAHRLAESCAEHGRASLAGDTFIWGAGRDRAAGNDRRLLQAISERAAEDHRRRNDHVCCWVRAVAEAVATTQRYFLAP